MKVDSRPDVVAAKVLCVSPNSLYQQGLNAMFSQAGYSFAHAPDGASAVRHAPQRYDALIIDLALPDMSGLALCWHWLAHDRDVPILHFASAPMEDYDQLVAACPHCFARREAEPAEMLEATRALIATRRAERALDQYLEAAPDATVLVDRHGTIVRVNARLETLFGYERSELHGRAVECLIPSRYQQTHTAHRERYEAAPAPRQMGTGLRLVGRRKDASEFPVDVALSPVGDYRAAAIRDVSAQRRLEDELRYRADALEAADQRKDEALAFVAHELRAPLGVLMTAATIPAADASGSLPLRNRPVVLRQIGYMARLVDDLLDVTRARTGQMHLQLEVCDLRSVVTGAVDITAPMFHSGHHTLTVDVPDTPVRVHGDAGRLQQVVVNLLGNAVKFSPQGGHIDLVLSQSGVDAVIVVRDAGAGIAAERLPSVFDPFSRQANDRSSRHAGLGLGLALAHRIVRLHHGEIVASSEGIGSGSTFSVHVPLWSAPAATS